MIFSGQQAGFWACPGDSIDYAVMEKTANAVVVPFSAGWSDVGAWTALWDVCPHDEHGNFTQGDVIAEDTHNAFLVAQYRCLATVGLDNIIVVETADAVLVASKDKAQNVKAIVNRLKADKREECKVHRQVYRPWGSYEGIDAGSRFQVKRLSVKPGAQLSLQMHHHRAEHWVVVKGTARVTCGDQVFNLHENESTYIPIGERHRLENPGTIPLEMIEIQSGSYLGEDDIVRFEDVYDRVQERDNTGKIMNKKVRKAVFPVAGLGTRFLPATKANPKEMLTIVDKPLIQYAAEEAVNAGIKELVFVTSSSKRAIEDHFDKNYELEAELERRGKHTLLNIVREVVPPNMTCVYVRQPEALGLGHAVLCAKPVVGDEPFRRDTCR